VGSRPMLMIMPLSLSDGNAHHVTQAAD
jgi:hypothetical protein